MPHGIRRSTALFLLIILLAQPLAAEQSGMVVKGEIFFAGRQGRWTLLIALTVLLGTEENYGLAMDAADKAFHIAESSGDDARAATALRYKAVLFEEQAKYAEAESAVRQALVLREKSVGPEDPAVADLLVTLARLRRRQNKLDGVEALLARAGARLDEDDLAGAVALLAGLPEPAARQAQPWLARARARLAAEAALGRLVEQALGAGSRAGG